MDLPFTSIECRDCGYLLDSEEQRLSHRCFGRDDLDALDARCAQFIARWNWRKTDPEAAVMRRELDELIAIARADA